MIYTFSTGQTDGMCQLDTTEELPHLDVIIDENCSTRFELSNKGDHSFSLEKGDIAIEISNENAIKLARGILMALNSK